MTPPELEEIHQAYHDTQPTAPALNDDTSSLPPYEKATSLYPSLSKPTPLFVVMDGIGQEEVTPIPSFVIETDEEEDVITVQPKSVGPASRTRSKQTKALKKAIPQLTKNLKQFSSMLEGVPVCQALSLQAPLLHHFSCNLRLHLRKRHRLKNRAEIYSMIPFQKILTT